MAETFTGTRAEVTAHLADLHARGELEAMTPPAPVADRPGLWTVRYVTLPPMPRTQLPVPRGIRWRGLAIAAGVALAVLGAVVAGAWWLWRHPAALILTVAGGVGVVWVARRVRSWR